MISARLLKEEKLKKSPTDIRFLWFIPGLL